MKTPKDERVQISWLYLSQFRNTMFSNIVVIFVIDGIADEIICTAERHKQCHAYLFKQLREKKPEKNCCSLF